jgi:hypothetical protein
MPKAVLAVSEETPIYVAMQLCLLIESRGSLL